MITCMDSLTFQPLYAGDGIDGVMTSISYTSSEYTSDPIPVLELVTDDGDAYEVRGYHAALRHEITRTDPKVGHRFAVKYMGKRSTRNGRISFHAYRVATV